MLPDEARLPDFLSVPRAITPGKYEAARLALNALREMLHSSPGVHASLKRTTGRCGFRRATSKKPTLSYIDFAPNHM